MNTITKYGYTYTIERTTLNDYTITAIDPMTGYSVTFGVQNLRLDNEPADYWRGQVTDYELDGYGFAYEVFIGELYADGYEFDDEYAEWVIENCLYEFAKWMEYIHTAEEDHSAQ
jgi:hypothetical protein